LDLRPSRPPLRLAAATVAAAWVAAFGLAGWVALYVQQPVHKDFRIFYVAAEAGIRNGWASIYDIATLRALSSSFPPGQNFIDSETAFVNPPLFAWVIAPLTALPLPVAYGLWTALSLAALVWSWHIIAPYRGMAKLALLLAGLALWPVVDALYYGQPSLLIIGLVAATWWLCTRDRQVGAGVVLALATALKPQVVIVLPIALLVAGRGRVFIGWAAGCVALAILFAATLGQTGIERWWHALSFLQSDPHHSYFTMAYVVGLNPLTYVVEGLLGALALMIAWLRRDQLDMVFAAGLIGSLAASIHLHQSDYAELVLVAWLVLRTSPSRWQKAWLLAGIVGMQAITLAMPLPQLVLDAAWLVGVAITGVSGMVGSTSAGRQKTAPDVIT
jgi:hypothetical protein